MKEKQDRITKLFEDGTAGRWADHSTKGIWTQQENRSF